MSEGMLCLMVGAGAGAGFCGVGFCGAGCLVGVCVGFVGVGFVGAGLAGVCLAGCLDSADFVATGLESADFVAAVLGVFVGLLGAGLADAVACVFCADLDSGILSRKEI